MSSLDEQLTKYLTDAHAIEEQALQQLRSAPDVVGEPELARLFRDHHAETVGHESLVRERLEARGADPSRIKDLVARAGGVGFLLFARLQPDTPGKLVSHAFSYEHFELALYELLGRVAERAEDEETVQAVERIRDEEAAMGKRLAESFDRAVDASLRGADVAEKLRKYLADAHAIEAQAAQLLEKGPGMAGSPELARIYHDHLYETREQQRLVGERIDALGGAASSVKDTAMRAGALNWGLFFQAQPDTPGKLAAFAFAFEHLEIAGYEQLKRVGERIDDRETAGLAERILAQERAAAERIRSAFDQVVEASLVAQGVPL